MVLFDKYITSIKWIRIMQASFNRIMLNVDEDEK